MSIIPDLEFESIPLPKSETEERLMAYSEVARNICPRFMYEYDQKLQKEVAPEKRLPWAKKMFECYTLATEKVETTPCENIRAAYEKCLKSGSHTRHSECYHFKDTLGKCVVKHFPAFED